MSNPLPTTRKTSSSSTNSTGHPPSSPIHQGQRGTSSAANFGMGMNSGLKSWEMWGGNSNAQRHPSGSSSTSVTDMSPQRDAWGSSRPSSGTWEISQTNDLSNSPSKKEYLQLDTQTLGHLPLGQHGRQSRSVSGLSGSRIVSLSGDDESRINPVINIDQEERLSGISKSSPRYSSVASPTRLNANTTYGSQGSIGASYDHGTVSVDDLAVNFRGMSVGDDYNAANQNSSYRAPASMPQAQTVAPQSSAPQVRVPHVVQHQSRPSFGGYTPQADYSAYYAGPPTIDYSYSYDNYRSNTDTSIYGSPVQSANTSNGPNLYPGLTPQTIHPHIHGDPHRPPAGLFYDFSASTRPPGSHFYYSPSQPIVYHTPTVPPSSMQSPVIAQLPPATLTDKKRELQYTIQQQQLSNQLYASVRHSTPSPHGPPFPTPHTYPGQLPLMTPSIGLYRTASGGNQALALFQQSMNHGRRFSAADSAAITLRSPLLEEFRVNKSNKWELKDIFGYVVEFSGDQHGSRFIQQKLETASTEEKQAVFDEIVPSAALQLIQDVFGNYVVQKLFEHGTQIQKSILASTMENHVLTLSLQMYGCRVVQKAIEYILPDQQVAFVKELEPHVLRCVKDANGNHVIQKLIERVSPDHLEFVHAFRGNVFELATHPYGCRVLQRSFEHLREDQTRPLLDELNKYTINLMQDQFGNYVVQFVLEHGPAQDRILIISKLRGQLLQMAKHKFASNVCEKALVTADAESRRLLIEEIITPKADGVSPVVTMMKDQFANYVLQRALTVVEGDQKDILISKIRPHLATMRRYSSAYSKHLISIERLLEKASSQSARERETSNNPVEVAHDLQSTMH